jgi:probable phosphoglycerate mutase
MAKKVLYLIRHGQYDSTTTPPQEPDGGLTEIGKQQAALTAERLRALPVSVIHHSTTQRATETAAIIAARFPQAGLRPSPLLRECIPSVPGAYKAQFAHIPADFIERSQPQAEQAFATYFRATLNGDSDQHEILVSHGNLISHLVCRVLQAPLDAWLNTDIQLCGLGEVVVGSQGRLRLVRHNDTGHLPPHLQV